MKIRYYVITIIFLIVAVGCYISYSYIVSLIHEVRNESQLTRNAKKNMTLLSQAIVSYARDHNGQLPLADNWCDELLGQTEKITKETFKAIDIESGACNFAFNRNLSGLDINSIPTDVIMFFEASGEWNFNGGAELLEEVHAQRQWVIGVMFVDGAFGEYFFATKNVRMKGIEKANRPLKWIP